MNIVAIDDDYVSLFFLENMLKNVPEVDNVNIFQSCWEAEEFIIKNEIHIIFFDIMLPKENGIHYAKRVRERFPEIVIIFMTAYKEYALDAFELYALDYMIKPITAGRLYDTLNRAVSYISRQVQSVDRKLRVYGLGSCNLKDAEGRPVRFTSSKSEELFHYLVLHNGKITNKWLIIEDLFPDMPVNNAETYLNTTVYKLRKVLKKYQYDNVVIYSNEGYYIDMEIFSVDYYQFKEKLSRIEQNKSFNPVLQLEQLFQIEELFQGELYVDKDYRWTEYEREHLTNWYKKLGKEICEYILLCKNRNWYDKALEILKKLEKLNDLDQDIVTLRMEIYKEMKDKTELIKAYRKYCILLKRELGIAPDDGLVRVYEYLLKAIFK